MEIVITVFWGIMLILTLVIFLVDRTTDKVEPLKPLNLRPEVLLNISQKEIEKQFDCKLLFFKPAIRINYSHQGEVSGYTVMWTGSKYSYETKFNYFGEVIANGIYRSLQQEIDKLINSKPEVITKQRKPRRDVTSKLIIEAKSLRAKGWKVHAIAKKVDLSPATVSRINQGEYDYLLPKKA